jgi:hypothetical protein
VTLESSVQSLMAKEHKLRKHREFLLEGVRTHILPVFIQQQFAVIPRVHSASVDEKSVDIFPFGRMRRPKTDGGVDLVEIQFMTYGRAAFRINARAVRTDEITTVGGHRAAVEFEAGGLHDHFEMYAYPRLWLWFSLRFWRFRTPVQSRYDRLALQVAGFLPEIELALRDDKLGPHVRKIVFPRGLQSAG